eukprot:3923011-Prymnesium_polylepis.3
MCSVTLPCSPSSVISSPVPLVAHQSSSTPSARPDSTTTFDPSRHTLSPFRRSGKPLSPANELGSAGCGSTITETSQKPYIRDIYEQRPHSVNREQMGTEPGREWLHLSQCEAELALLQLAARLVHVAVEAVVLEVQVGHSSG